MTLYSRIMLSWTLLLILLSCSEDEVVLAVKLTRIKSEGQTIPKTVYANSQSKMPYFSLAFF